MDLGLDCDKAKHVFYHLVLAYKKLGFKHRERVAEVVRPKRRTHKKRKSTPVYVASKIRKTYHTPNCPWAKMIKRKYRVKFKTKDSAKRFGYKPHKCTQLDKIKKKTVKARGRKKVRKTRKVNTKKTRYSKKEVKEIQQRIAILEESLKKVKAGRNYDRVRLGKLEKRLELNKSRLRRILNT